jgi:glycosyltransferase involved in cell wall biosynthesis
MDLAFIDTPEFFKRKDYLQLKSWTSYSVKKARKVIAISESTKSDIIKHYHRDSKDIVVAYPGFSPSLSSSLKSQVSTNPYILFVGTIQPRKNLVRLIKAFEKINANVDLVLAGREGWLADDIYKAINTSQKKHAIKLLGFVRDEELPSLYKNSACVVMPGLYEGFGLPALEAIYHDTIPVVANTGSLPEVVGPDGLVFDPYSVESISESLTNAIQLKPQEKAKLLVSAKQHAKKFSWGLAAKNIRKVFDEIIVS